MRRRENKQMLLSLIRLSIMAIIMGVSMGLAVYFQLPFLVSLIVGSIGSIIALWIDDTLSGRGY